MLVCDATRGGGVVLVLDGNAVRRFWFLSEFSLNIRLSALHVGAVVMATWAQ